jgi:D-alanyl-D-alanine carboxypeptidase
MHRQNRRSLVLFTMILVALLTVTSCGTKSDPELTALLKVGIKRGYPGIAMLTQSGEGKIRSAADGYSNLEKRIALRTDDAFQMASVNKTFTAVAILRLVDERKLSLNATLKEELGEASARIPYSDRITISQLLDHSSGIYATNNDMEYLTTVIGPKADPTRVWKAEELIALADKDRKKPSSEPGVAHFYADTNYVLLGMIVEHVSGRPFKEYITSTLLKPLGMHSTYFYSDFVGRKSLPPVEPIQGYLLATEDIRSAIEINSRFKPVPGERRKEGELLNTTAAAERVDFAAGLVTTLPDLLRFASALFRGKLLSPQSQKFIMSVGDGMMEEPIDKKRVWALQAIRKPYGVLIYKEGDGPGGVNTLMAYRPATDEIYLGFTNSFGYFNEIDFFMDDVIGKFP